MTAISAHASHGKTVFLIPTDSPSRKCQRTETEPYGAYAATSTDLSP